MITEYTRSPALQADKRLRRRCFAMRCVLKRSCSSAQVCLDWG